MTEMEMQCLTVSLKLTIWLNNISLFHCVLTVRNLTLCAGSRAFQVEVYSSLEDDKLHEETECLKVPLNSTTD